MYQEEIWPICNPVLCPNVEAADLQILRAIVPWQLKRNSC